MQERRDSIANALELHLSCTKPSIYFQLNAGICNSLKRKNNNDFLPTFFIKKITNNVSLYLPIMQFSGHQIMTKWFLELWENLYSTWWATEKGINLVKKINSNQEALLLKIQNKMQIIEINVTKSYSEKAWACVQNGITQRGRLADGDMTTSPLGRVVMSPYANPRVV